MLFSLPVLAILAVHFISATQAIPVPQGVNAPAGPAMTTSSDLSNTIGDLVIPQAEASNDTAAAVYKQRSAPKNLDELVEDIGDFRLPTNSTADSVVKAVK